jgi:serine/threonine protein kinase
MLASNEILQNRYVILRKLGEGGMGNVYEAKDLRLQVSIALKETRFSDVSLRNAFAHEAQLLASLRHPALPKVINHFSDARGQFLVMEFIDGDDMGSLMERTRKPFAINDVLGWADQLLDAVHYLHTRRPPVIHRDVKPQNLKLNDDGKVILLDFGLSKSMVSGTIVSGYSNYYSSPEQRRGTNTIERSDSYSVAATMYSLLTGAKPRDAQEREAAIASELSDPLLSPRSLNPQVNASIAAVLFRAMSLNPEERFVSADQMQLSLRLANESQVTVQNQIAVGVSAPTRFEIPLDGSYESEFSSSATDSVEQPRSGEKRQRSVDRTIDLMPI